MPLSQVLIAQNQIIFQRLKDDLGLENIHDCALEFDFYDGRHYQDLIWLSNYDDFTVNILQFCKRNQVITEKFFNMPIIGNNTHIQELKEDNKKTMF